MVDVQAIGVNFTDTYSRAGVNPVPRLPWTVGVEAAGVVSAVGPDVSEVAEGDDVAFCSFPPGCYAEKVAVQSWRLVKRPQGVDARTGAAAILQGMTAHYLCHSTYAVQQDDRVSRSCRSRRYRPAPHPDGPSVSAATSSPPCPPRKRPSFPGRAGADHVILYTQQDFAEEVKSATNGQGVHVVYDAVGKTTFDQSVSCLARRGFMVLYGQASGAPDPVDPRRLGPGSLYLTRPGLADYMADRNELDKRSTDVLNWVQSGELKLRVEHVFSLAEAAEAHRQLEGRSTTGKLLLIP